MVSDGESPVDPFAVPDIEVADRMAADLAGQIRAMRLAAGLTQAQLADAAGVTQSAVSEFERGSARPTLKTFCRIVVALKQGLVVTGREPGPQWMHITVMAPPEMGYRFLELARQVGFRDVDWCEMEEPETLARLDFAPRPAVTAAWPAPPPRG